MPREIVLVRKNDGSFIPASDEDKALASGWRAGQAVKVAVTTQSARSLQHHRLYWGGLIALTFDYWEPKGGFIGASEKQALKEFCNWLDARSGNTGAIKAACSSFAKELAEKRAAKIESPTKSKEQLHEWIKVKAGWYELVLSPTGIKKVPKATNFNAMGQEEFNKFYKAAFGVCWRFILSRTFENEEQAQGAIDQLLAMG